MKHVHPTVASLEGCRLQSQFDVGLLERIRHEQPESEVAVSPPTLPYPTILSVPLSPRLDTVLRVIVRIILLICRYRVPNDDDYPAKRKTYVRPLACVYIFPLARDDHDRADLPIPLRQISKILYGILYPHTA